MKYTLIRNGQVVDSYSTKTKAVEEMYHCVNEYEDLEPDLVVKGDTIYAPPHAIELQLCEVYVFRLRTLCYEQYLIVEGNI